MKNCILILILTVLSVLNSFGQGSIIFSNAGGDPLIRLQAGGARVPIGSAFQAELMYAPDGTPIVDFNAAATRIGAPANFGPTPGFFSGGGRTVTTMQPPGGFGLFQIRVWETAYGQSFAAAIASGDPNAEMGITTIMRIDTANPVIGEPNVSIGPSLIWLPGYPIVAVPEPSTIVLGLAGVGALLLFRCRK